MNIGVKDGILHLKQRAPPSMPSVSSDTVVRPDAPPLHEIRLLHNHSLTTPSSRSFDRKAKIHQIKLRQTQVGGRGGGEGKGGRWGEGDGRREVGEKWVGEGIEPLLRWCNITWKCETSLVLNCACNIATKLSSD